MTPPPPPTLPSTSDRNSISFLHSLFGSLVPFPPPLLHRGGNSPASRYRNPLKVTKLLCRAIKAAIGKEGGTKGEEEKERRRVTELEEVRSIIETLYPGEDIRHRISVTETRNE